MTYDSSTGDSKIFINGHQVAKNNPGRFEIATNYLMRLGAGINLNDTRYFKGRISCLQIYNNALTQQQIRAARYKCSTLSKYFLKP